jgi:hypothetical protein
MMSDQATPPPQVAMLQMMMGMWVSQIVSATAQLRIPDLIAAGTTNVDDLAREANANAGALQRLLRAAATLGVVAETAPRTFALTPLGETLRSDVRGTLRDLVIAETAPGHWLPWGRLAESVREGRSLSSETLGIPVWEYYANHQEEGLSFARGMGNLSAMVSEEVAAVYQVGDAKTIVDVGGSQGALLRGVLRNAPSARGILFDRPEVIATATADDRIELIAGDFFTNVPKGADVYLLKSILHDWPDEKCVEILKVIHRDAAPNARLVLVEMLLTNAPGPVTFMDLNMLVMLDGRERTADEYGAMLRPAGFAVERVVPTPGLFGVIEARRQ